METTLDDVPTLPHLTLKQHNFLQCLLQGDGPAAAYRAAYDTACTPRTAYRNGRRLEQNWKVVAWLDYIRARLQGGPSPVPSRRQELIDAFHQQFSKEAAHD